MFFQTPAWDLTLFRLLNDSWTGPVPDFLALLFSAPYVMWGLGALYFARLCRGPRRGLPLLALFFAAAIGLADLSASLAKQTFGRERPLNALAGARYHEDGAWRTRPADHEAPGLPGSSYPSAHAANSMATALCFIVLPPLALGRTAGRARWLALALPLAVGWSRAHLGKHYPSDVLAGWLLGAACFLALRLLYPVACPWRGQRLTDPPKERP